MIAYPCCKINLGLNIVRKREDGYHDLETIFYPVPLTDVLEIRKMDDNFPSATDCDLKVTGNAIACNEQDNLIIKAYNLLAKDFAIPRVHAHLYKRIPSQAGLGGGSSDAAFMIRLLDKKFHLNIGNAEMERYAAKLGADCAFFITAETAFATGIGDQLSPADNEEGSLEGYHLVLVKPDIPISTAEAFANIQPKQPAKCCKDIVKQPIETWKNELINDFEEPVFKNHPELKRIKEQLYEAGALYAQMSGSGSTIFGIFRTCPDNIAEKFKDMFVYSCQL